MGVEVSDTYSQMLEKFPFRRELYYGLERSFFNLDVFREGIVNARRYLYVIVEPYIIHTPLDWRLKLFRNKKVQVLEWSANSPNLNRIVQTSLTCLVENAWISSDCLKFT